MFRKIGKALSLGKNQIKIIEILSLGEKNAEELSTKSGIPKVKIYTFLNELINSNAIKKTTAFPSRYYISSIEDTIQNLLDKKFENFMDKRAEILSFLENSDLKQVTKSIFSENEYTKALIDVYSKNNALSIISKADSFPRFLCPKDKQNYLRYRNTVQKYRKKFTEHENNIDKTALYSIYTKMLNGKRPVRQTISKAGLSNYFAMVSKEFGKCELKRRLVEIKNDLQKYDFEVRVVNSEYPFNLHVTNSSVCFATVCKNCVIGFSSIDKSLISTYNKLFEEEWENGTDFKDAIKNYKKGV